MGKKLNEATSVTLANSMRLLLEETNDHRADQICHELVEYWIGYANSVGKSELGSPHQYDQSGLILSPELAGACAFGVARTRRYLQALYQVVTELLTDKTDGAQVRVLYPGCGPYGILALPLLALFSSDQLCVDVIDYHKASIDSIKQLADAFGFADRIQCSIGDALDYQIPDDEMPDVIISELLLAGLEKEGHVAINEQLLHQAPSAILIPERIDLSLCFADPNVEFAMKTMGDHRVSLGRVFSMNRESLLASDLQNDEVSGETLRLPEKLDKCYQSFLFTEIILCQGIVLREYENGLTTPVLYPLPKGFQFAQALQFSYLKGASPRLLCRVI